MLRDIVITTDSKSRASDLLEMTDITGSYHVFQVGTDTVKWTYKSDRIDGLNTRAGKLIVHATLDRHALHRAPLMALHLQSLPARLFTRGKLSQGFIQSVEGAEYARQLGESLGLLLAGATFSAGIVLPLTSAVGNEWWHSTIPTKYATVFTPQRPMSLAEKLYTACNDISLQAGDIVAIPDIPSPLLLEKLLLRCSHLIADRQPSLDTLVKEYGPKKRFISREETEPKPVKSKMQDKFIIESGLSFIPRNLCAFIELMPDVEQGHPHNLISSISFIKGGSMLDNHLATNGLSVVLAALSHHFGLSTMQWERSKDALLSMDFTHGGRVRMTEQTMAYSFATPISSSHTSLFTLINDSYNFISKSSIQTARFMKHDTPE